MKYYTFDIERYLWHRQGFDGIDYSDGQEIEKRIFNIISEASDLSVLSEELRLQITDWPTEYHLSSLRHCLLRPLGIQAGDRVLELGCGCGAITRYLGETGANVIAVEGSGQRARIAAQRCRDLDNVRVVLDNLVSFDTELRFDWVLLIGVLEYAPLFAESVTGNPVQKYLESSSAFLSDNGKLVIAIENQLGLKYFNGCGEDHVARPFFGIHDLYDDNTPITFGKEELQLVLQQAGLNSLDFYYPWPDYKLPKVILHSSAFFESNIHISDLLLRCTSQDYTGNSLRVFSEQFAMPVLERNNLLEDLANSFLVIAGKGEQRQKTTRQDFVWIYSSGGRQRSLCTETKFVRSSDPAILVEKSRLDMAVSEPVVLPGKCSVVHRCASGSFHQGPLLVREIIRKRAKALSNEEIAEGFFSWFEEIRGIATLIEGKPENQLESWYLSGKYIDATPFNYIRADNNKLILFDTEWEITDEIPLGWLLFRAVVWGWFGSVPDNQQHGLTSVYGIIAALCAAKSLTVHAHSMMQWQEMDLSFQTVIANRQPGSIPPQFLASESESCFLYADKQQQRIDMLEAYIGSMQRQVNSLYSSSSWRYSRIIRSCGNLSALFRKIAAAGNLVDTGRKVKDILSQDGWKGLQLRIAYALHGPVGSSLVPVGGSTDDLVEANDYDEWISRYDILNSETENMIRTRIDSFARHPVISIVMPVCDPPIALLEEAIESVCDQLYPHWELCIADDASINREVSELLEKYRQRDDRIKVVFRHQNGHISKASNSALELVQGEFIALLDHDDLLSPYALFMVADAINKFPDVQLLYSDEDKIDLQGKRHTPSFKCDWNPDLFLSYNLFSHLGVYRATLIRRVGGFRPGFEGAQDYDLALRCIEQVSVDQIVHIPHVLYHWRVVEGSTALATDEKPYAMAAGLKAISEYLQRNTKEAVCEQKENAYRVRYSVPASQPMVSLIIPATQSRKCLKACIGSILSKTGYDNYEILIVVNSHRLRDTSKSLQKITNNPRIRIIQVDCPENNDAQLYNSGVQQAQGDVIGLLHDDIEVISKDWLEELVSHACRKEIGAVGARLWYRDNTLQHGGIVLGIRGIAGHAHRGTVKGFPGYRRRGELIQNFSAVSAACLFIEKSLFDYIGGFDEQEFGAWLYDVDFCMKLREQGYRNLWTPYAELYHTETSSLNNEKQTVPQTMIIQAQLEFLNRWGRLSWYDPAYSPNLTLQSENFSLAWPPKETLGQFCKR